MNDWLTRAVILVAGSAFLGGAAPVSTTAPLDVQLYALDCGAIEFAQPNLFSDTDSLPEKPVSMAAPCFLVKHGRDWMMWDTGLSDALVGEPRRYGPATLHVRTTLASQLKQLGLVHADIKFVAFSHLHSDHTGNANSFRSSTWLVNALELAAAVAGKGTAAYDNTLFKDLMPANRVSFEGDHDVFGDGTVVIISTPGHTPGHSSLKLNLKRSGTMILSGDLWHLHASRKQKLIPDHNSDRADTLASFDRVDGFVRNGARLVIQHAKEDFAALPRFPAYLD